VKKNYWREGGIFVAFICRQNQEPVAPFERGVLTVVRIKIALLLGMTPCSLAEKYQDLGRNFAFNSYPDGSKLVTIYHITGLRKEYFRF